MPVTLIRLRYPTTCGVCGRELPRGDQAQWNREAKKATCVRCLDGDTAAALLDRGKAGSSAAREWKRRHERREQQVLGRHKHLGGLILALSDDPQSTKAWAKGSDGEHALGRSLDRLRDQGIAVLHDRRIPGSRANIDHIAISPAGVFVVDAKDYRGRVEKRDVGGFFHLDERLYVGGRDRSKLIAGMAKQVAAVRSALSPDFTTVPITPVICFVDADWSLFARPLRFDAVRVVWPRALGELIRAAGSLGPARIGQTELRLGLALPAA